MTQSNDLISREAALASLHGLHNYCARAVIRGLPVLPVKPLVWAENHFEEWTYSAQTPRGELIIRIVETQVFGYRVGNTGEVYPTLEAAKSAVQDYYDVPILAPLKGGKV